MDMEPVRISVIGIDGSGKSSTTLKAIHFLSQHLPICKTGRNPFSIWKGNIFPCLPKMANGFESLFKRIDATKKRQWIGLTRLVFVFFQGWLEPYMIRKYHPGLVMTTRCMIIDPAIYSDFYYPWISQRVAIESKLRFAQRYSRLPFRDLYFFLDTPVQTAMERIYKRISDDHPEVRYGRDYWLHLHEHEESLRELDRKFRKTLTIAQRIAPFKVVEINTTRHAEEEVSNLIFDHSMNFHKGDPFGIWEKM
jgi:thymidylate kinase